MSDQKNLEIPKKELAGQPNREGTPLEVMPAEKKAEVSAAENNLDQAQASREVLSSIQSLPVKSDEPSPSDIRLTKVENILSDGMESVFLSLDASTQEIFKIKGEETAIKINTLLQKAKVRFSEILNLITDWLKIIPKVNKYYLEQEAKIKADAIIKLYNKK